MTDPTSFSNSLTKSNQTALDSSGPKSAYLKYALVNPVNIVLLCMVPFFAIVQQQWWLLGLFFSLEALWLLLAPNFRPFRKPWLDKLWLQEKEKERKKKQSERFEKLAKKEKIRALQFRELQKRIEKMAQDNSSLSMELLRPEISRLEDLVDDFLDLSLLSQNYHEYAKSGSLQKIEDELHRYETQIKELSQEDERRVVAQKNYNTLLKRKEKQQELMRNLQIIEGQLEGMEHSFQLLADEILGMRHLADFSKRLSEMTTGIELVRQTYQETELFWADSEEKSLSGSSQSLGQIERDRQVVSVK